MSNVPLTAAVGAEIVLSAPIIVTEPASPIMVPGPGDSQIAGVVEREIALSMKDARGDRRTIERDVPGDDRRLGQEGIRGRECERPEAPEPLISMVSVEAETSASSDGPGGGPSGGDDGVAEFSQFDAASQLPPSEAQLTSAIVRPPGSTARGGPSGPSHAAPPRVAVANLNRKFN